MPPDGGITFFLSLVCLYGSTGVLTLLVSDAAACFTCRLARCLALAAAALSGALTEIFRFQSFYVLHNRPPN